MTMEYTQPMHTMYEINTAVWLTRLSQRYGAPITLATIPAQEIDTLLTYGIDTVWLMGVWQRSPLAAQISRHDEDLMHEIHTVLPDFNDDDLIGSAYAVQSYTVDERFGGESALREFREQLQRRGMKLVLDFVPNHTAFDHHWINEHPEYYISGSQAEQAAQPDHFRICNGRTIANGSDPNLTPWPDVAQLNAFSLGYRDASIETLRSISELCDGVRCDMAMLMLRDVFSRSWGDRAGVSLTDEYWHVVIEAVRSYTPHFQFIAEAYWDTEAVLIEQGFDFCYDKPLYDRIIAGDEAATRDYVAATTTLRPHLVHFIENHDEQRAARKLTVAQQESALQLMTSLPGLQLWHDGQFEGNQVKIPVHLGRGPNEPVNPDIQALYRRMLTNTPDHHS